MPTIVKPTDPNIPFATHPNTIEQNRTRPTAHVLPRQPEET